MALLLAAAALLITGEAVRVDLGQRALVVKIAGRAPREVEFTVDAATRISASGRSLLLEDVRPGDRVLVSGTEAEAGRGQARFVRVGAARAAVPDPNAVRSAPRSMSSSGSRRSESAVSRQGKRSASRTER
jgi:hypothetical protein